MDEPAAHAFAVAFLIAAAPALGSFAAVVGDRGPAGRGWMLARSACPACATPLTRRELVPLASWLVQRGRCRTCAGRIAWRYPIAEAVPLAAALVALAVLPLAAAYLAVAAACVLVAAGVARAVHARVPVTACGLLAALGLIASAPGAGGPMGHGLSVLIALGLALSAEWGITGRLAPGRPVTADVLSSLAAAAAAAAWCVPLQTLALVPVAAALVGVGVLSGGGAADRLLTPFLPGAGVAVWAAGIAG